MKSNNKYLNVLFFTLSLCACKSQIVQYRIADHYSGPCAVFVVSSTQVHDKSYIISLDNGLGAVTNELTKKRFIFQSIETKKEIEIIPIGKETEAEDNVRYVFRLTNDFTSSDCTSKDIHKISFFIANKSDFLNWRKEYDDELEYFKLHGIDWCKYYKNLFKHQ